MKQLSPNALAVLQSRYLWVKKSGKLESPAQMFERVAKHVAKGNLALKKRYLKALECLEFLPNSPTLMNAGKKNGQLAACFVLPLEDDLSQIMDTLKLTALIHQSGGGTGFNFSNLRPEGSPVNSSRGAAAGPIGFLNLFNSLTETIRQGGLRRGANMGILSAEHADIEKFIDCKLDTSKIKNFNLSVSCSNQFMKKSKQENSFESKIFDKICQAAWNTGEPGLIFIDQINKFNPTPALGKIEATNPCGEQPLLPYEACNLGSINLNCIFGNKGIDFNKLAEVVETGVLFLNSVIDTCYYPAFEIEKLCRTNRKIGLGVMGFADLLIKLKIRYDSIEAFKVADEVMGFIYDQAIKVSQQLAKKKGAFDGYSKSLWKKRGVKPLRNATLTTIAPTGTISLIADCSPGIEPIFSFISERHVLDGKVLKAIHPEFDKFSAPYPDYFITSGDISPLDHVKMQAVFQKHSDSAVSKTINLKRDASVNDVREAFTAAFDLGCKGITVYRDGSRPNQVMQSPENCFDCK